MYSTVVSWAYVLSYGKLNLGRDPLLLWWALDAIWWFSLAIAVIGFLCVGLERGLSLRTELDTEYGLDDGKPEAKEHHQEEDGVPLTDVTRQDP